MKKMIVLLLVVAFILPSVFCTGAVLNEEISEDSNILIESEVPNLTPIDVVFVEEVFEVPNPVNIESILYYNKGDCWESIKVSEWDGDVSLFELWNFAPDTESSLRYWDSEMKEPVCSDLSDSENYFWIKDNDGKSLKAKWDKCECSVEAL
jgi:hypothetical protein